MESEIGKGTTFTFWVKCLAGGRHVPRRFDHSKSHHDLVGLSKRSFTSSKELKKLMVPMMPRIMEKVNPLNDDKDPTKSSFIEGEDESTNEFSSLQGVGEIKASPPKKFLHDRMLMQPSGLSIDTCTLMLPVESNLSSVPSKPAKHGMRKRPNKKFVKRQTVELSQILDVKLMPKLLLGKSRPLSPRTYRSKEFEDALTPLESSNYVTGLSFVPGKDMSLNTVFLQNHVSAIPQSKLEQVKPNKVRTYHNTMIHLNHPCKCPIVLIVDDNEINKIALSGMLQRLGLIYREASNELEAINVLKEENRRKDCCGGVKLVLMDCDMPIMDGIEASTKIRDLINNGEIMGTTIVAATAYYGAKIEKECLDAGMEEYITKPMDIGKLVDCIERRLAPKCIE